MGRRNCSVVPRKGNVLVLKRGRWDASESLEGAGVHALKLCG